VSASSRIRADVKIARMAIRRMTQAQRPARRDAWIATEREAGLAARMVRPMSFHSESL